MTAAAGVLTGLAKLKRQDSSRSQHRPVAALPPGLQPGNQEGLPRKRKRRADVVVVRGTLRLYSASGFFLLLGLLVLALGIGMATLGYWPHGGGPPQRHRTDRNDTVPFLTTTRGENTATPATAAAAAATGSAMVSRGDVRGVKMAAAGTGGEEEEEEEEARMYNSSASDNVPGNSSAAGAGATARGLLARFLEQHRHSERMKMLGPFTMGIGIFIFICANAILHENRDRETKVIHMRDMYSTVIDIHRLRQREYKHRPQPLLRHGSSFYVPSEPGESGAPPLAFSHRGGGGAGSTEEEEGLLGAEFQRAAAAGPRWGRGGSDLSDLLAGPLWPPAERTEWGGACSIVSSSLSAFTLPVIKLNNCVIDEPEMEAITEGTAAVTAGGWRDGGERGPRQQQQERSSRGVGGGGGGPPGGGTSPPSMLSLVVPVATVARAAASKPPGLQRSLSATSCSSPRSSSSSSSSSSSLSPAAPSSTSGCWLSPGRATASSSSSRSHQDLQQQQQGNSDSSSSFPPSLVSHMLGGHHSKSLDLERCRVPSALSVPGWRGGGAEHHHHHHQQQQRIERKHPSWPRLDRSSSGGSVSSGGGSRKGYVLLEDREEGTTGDRSRGVDGGPPPPPTAAVARRDYSKREKLLMISRSHNNLSFEHDEFNSGALKRGSSETRF